MDEADAPLAELSGAHADLVLSEEAAGAAWRTLRDAVDALALGIDGMRLVVYSQDRFGAARGGQAETRRTVPLQNDLIARTEAMAEATARVREALAACAQQDQALRANVDAFLKMAIDRHIADRLPEETTTVRPPLPIIDLVNQALGDAVNNISDTAPLDQSLVALSLF